MKDDPVNHLVRWRLYPVQFVREVFCAEPDPWQIDVLNAFPHNQRIAMKASKGVGKTCILAWVIWNFLATRKDPMIACVSIDSKNLKNGLWTELARWRHKSKFLMDNFEQTAERISILGERKKVHFCEARPYAKTADKNEQANTLAGLHANNIMFVLDETGGMSDSIMATAEAALSTAEDGHLIQAGNPTRLEGPLYTACTKNAHLWYVVSINSDPDNPKRSPRVSKEWANQQIQMYGRDNAWVLVNVFGQFPPHSLDALIGPDEVRDAMNRMYTEYDLRNYSKILGVDVARFGDDSSVIARRYGRQMMNFSSFRNLDSLQGAGVTSRIWNEFKADACFIDNTGGFGSGWIDQLRVLNRNPIGIHFAGKPHKTERYANKRTEMYFDLCEWIKEGGALPKCDNLLAALTSTTYTFTRNNLMIIEPKEVIKSKLNGRSPDEADAAALTFAEPVQPINGSLGRRRQAFLKSDYNPFKEDSFESIKSYNYNAFSDG